MSKPNFEIIQPRNPLREKLGNKAPALDPAALARAEAALRGLSGQFQQWMEEEIERVDAAREAAQQRRFDEESLLDLYGRAHDAKGMGTTYEYPLVTRIAGSLCRLLDTEETRAVATQNPGLVCAHVDAMKAAVRDKIKTDEDPVGRALATELESFVAKALVGIPEDR